MLTKEKKAMLIEAYKRKFGGSNLISEETKLERANAVEERMVNKLNNVTPALWSVKLKEVLAVERHHKLELRTLLKDVGEVRTKPFLTTTTKGKD